MSTMHRGAQRASHNDASFFPTWPQDLDLLFKGRYFHEKGCYVISSLSIYV
jgi:hypothetical protein